MIMSTKKNSVQPVKKVLINNPSRLNEWAKSLRILRRSDESKIFVFDFNEFSFYENVNISTQVDYYYTASGSKTGSFLMILTFLTTICTYFILGGSFPEITFTRILMCIGLTILGAMIGKMIGLLNARWNLIKLAKDMQRRLNESYAPKRMLA